MPRWWVIRCRGCGRVVEARPAEPWWVKREEEEEVECEGTPTSGRRWYIGDQLTRIVNESHYYQCERHVE
jgi:hypothetical protein